jgi:glycosyltransferase involved in cell wall biosynthesis
MDVVSVIIPVHNGAAFLGDAVSSALRQGKVHLEIIVVDDGSTDETADAASTWGNQIRYVRQPQAGPAAARNHGVALSRGEVLAFLDADDVWTADKLSRQLARLGSAPPVDVVVDCTQPVREVVRDDGRKALEPCAPTWGALLLGSALMRRATFDAVGGFDEALFCGEDVDWFLRAREQGVAIEFTTDVGLLYRIHPNSLTRDTKARDRYFLMSLKRSLERRRQRGDALAALPPIPGLDEVARRFQSAATGGDGRIPR